MHLWLYTTYHLYTLQSAQLPHFTETSVFKNKHWTDQGSGSSKSTKTEHKISSTWKLTACWSRVWQFAKYKSLNPNFNLSFNTFYFCGVPKGYNLTKVPNYGDTISFLLLFIKKVELSEGLTWKVKDTTKN